MEKKGLGRGLAALISNTMEEESGTRVQELSIGQIVANPFQPRTLFDPLKQEELVASIKEHGVLQPILVKRIGHERYQLIAGERRFRASQAARLETIPALIKDLGDREQLEVAIVENVQREDIGALEAARAYRRLSDEFGMTQDQIAQRVGKSRSSVANVIGLLDLPDPIQESLESGLISEGHARAIKVARDEAAMLRIHQAVLQRQLSVRETEKLVREVRDPTLTTPLQTAGGHSVAVGAPASGNGMVRSNGLSDPHEAYATDQLREALGTKVSIRHTSGGAGKIEIDFYSRQELERLVDLLSRRGHQDGS